MATFNPIGTPNSGSARQVGPGPTVNRADPGRGFQQAGETLGQLGQQLRQEQQEQQRRRDQVVAAEKRAEFQRTLDVRLNDLDPTSGDFQERAQEIFEVTRQEVLNEANIQDPDIRARLETNLTRQEEAARADVIQRQDEALEQKALNQVEKTGQQAVVNVADDPAAFEAELTKATDVIESMQNLSEQQRQELKRSTRKSLAEARVDGLARAGQFGRARNVADRFAKQGVFGDETRQRLNQAIRQREDQAEEQRLRETTKQVNDLDVAITAANSTSELQAVQNRFEQARNQGLFEGRQGERARLQKKIIRRRRDFREDQRRERSALQRVTSGIGPTTQEEANLLWRAVNQDGREGGTGDVNRLAELDTFVQRTGFAPSPANELIEQAERRADVATLAQGISAYARIKRANPNIKTEARNSGSRVRFGKQIMEAQGVGAEQAANIVNSLQDVDRGKLADQFEEKTEELDFAGDLREAVGGEGGFLPLIGADEAAVPASIRREYENRMRTNFIATGGDMERAKRLTRETMKEEFGPTRVEGETRIAKFPVEKAFVQTRGQGAQRALEEAPETTSEALRQDVEGELKSAGISVPPAPESLEGTPRFRLVPTAETKRQLANGNPPEYEVRVRNSNGIYEQIRLENGETFKYTPPEFDDGEGGGLKSMPAMQEVIDKETQTLKQNLQEQEERMRRQRRRGPSERREESIREERRQAREEAQAERAARENEVIQEFRRQTEGILSQEGARGPEDVDSDEDSPTALDEITVTPEDSRRNTRGPSGEQ